MKHLDYYDKILGGIAVSLGLGTSIGMMTTLPMQYSVGTGAAVALILIYHGMFRHGPE